MPASVESLVKRYRVDPRFGKNNDWRNACIDNLLRLNSFLHTFPLEPHIKAIVLGGSYSANYPDKPPDIGEKPIYGPFHIRQSGGSDLDLLILHSYWFAFGRTLGNVQRKKFEQFLKLKADQTGYRDIFDFLHISSEPISLGYIFLPQYAKSMVRTGTKIVGKLSLKECGIERENPPRNEKSDFDPIVSQMSGGF